MVGMGFLVAVTVGFFEFNVFGLVVERGNDVRVGNVPLFLLMTVVMLTIRVGALIAATPTGVETRTSGALGLEVDDVDPDFDDPLVLEVLLPLPLPLLVLVLELVEFFANNAVVLDNADGLTTFCSTAKSDLVGMSEVSDHHRRL